MNLPNGVLWFVLRNSVTCDSPPVFTLNMVTCGWKLFPFSPHISPTALYASRCRLRSSSAPSPTPTQTTLGLLAFGKAPTPSNDTPNSFTSIFERRFLISSTSCIVLSPKKMSVKWRFSSATTLRKLLSRNGLDALEMAARISPGHGIPKKHLTPISVFFSIRGYNIPRCFHQA